MDQEQLFDSKKDGEIKVTKFRKRCLSDQVIMCTVGSTLCSTCVIDPKYQT